MTWKITADSGESRTFDSRSEAEDAKADLEDLGMTIDLAPEEQAEPVSDGGSVEHDGENAVAVPDQNESDTSALPASPDVTEDPLR